MSEQRMSEQQLIEIVAASTPITDERLAALDLDQAESELLEEIIGSAGSESSRPSRPARAFRPRKRLALRVGAALAGAAAAVILILGGDEPGGNGHGTVAYAAEWIRIAENNPRLLVTAPSWEVTHADVDGRNSGGMTFSDGEAELELHWYPVEDYRSYFQDRLTDYGSPEEIEVVGRPASLFDAGFDSYGVMFKPRGKTFVEITGDTHRQLAKEEFVALLGTLEAVGVDTWLAALPPSVVRSVDEDTVVREILKGVPLPPGFDIDSLDLGHGPRDLAVLGALVIQPVTCGWLELRMSGLRSGDQGKVREAEQALATAPTWPILLEMKDKAGWVNSIWDWAEDGRGSSGYGRDTTENPVPELGCNRAAWDDVPRIDPEAKR